MPIPRFRMVRPGETLSAEQLNRQAEELTRLGTLSGCTTAGAVEVTEGGYGLALRLDLPAKFPARITEESGGAYGFVQQVALSDGTFEDTADGFSGTPATTPAYELNGQTGVPVDTIVWMWQAHPFGAVEHFLFEYVGSTAPVWVRITAADEFAYDGVEAEPIEPTTGGFATSTGEQFQDVSGGRTWSGNLRERNWAANVPLGSHVLATEGPDGWWIFDFEQDHFTGRITAGTGPSYTVLETSSGGTNARTVTASEMNGELNIPTGTVVKVWVYTSASGALTYDFAYEQGTGPSYTSYTDITINDVDLGDIVEGDVVCIKDTMGGTVVCYRWACFDDGICGWINTCTCAFTPVTDTGCCVASLAGSLVVTADNFSGCACADGEEGSLYSGDGNTASGQISVFCDSGQRQINLYLYCASGGTGASDWKLAWNVSDPDEPACLASGTASTVTDMGYEAACSPFSMYFDLTFPAECCNTTGADVTIRLHIVESP